MGLTPEEVAYQIANPYRQQMLNHDPNAKPVERLEVSFI